MTALTAIKDVTRYRIDLPKSYQRMERAFERYNEQFDKPKVKLPHIFLARELIRLYAREFQRWQVARGFAVQLDWEEMPLLAANNQFLAEITGRTDRSVRNYRKMLEKAGFIAPLGHDDDGEPVYSVFHGRTCDYELAICPDFLWIESNRTTACLRVKNAPTTRSRKNFPPTSTGYVHVPLQEQPELVGGKICSEAEKNASRQTPMQEDSASKTPEPPEQQEPASGNRQEQPEPRNRNGDCRQQAREENRPAAQARTVSGNVQGPDRDMMMRQYAKSLYNYARAWLYPGEEIPKGRRLAIIARLITLFGQAPPDKLLKITRLYTHRLKLAQLYWHREHGALPIPERFFDPENTQDGFILTKKWPNDRQKYPPPPRDTYRLPTGKRRGPGRIGEFTAIRDII